MQRANFFKTPDNDGSFLLKCVELNLPASISNLLFHRAHSTLDEVLERMLHSVPGDEEMPQHPQGHTLGLVDN